MATKTVVDATIHRRHVTAELYRGARLERVNFDNCSATRCTFRDIELLACRVWSCTLRDPILEDVLISDVRTTVIDGPGKRTPFFLWGGMARHVRLQGRMGGLIWNPPQASLTDGQNASFGDDVKRYYGSVDWALDVSEARFQSVPAFRFGPPGHLVRRDPGTQPLVRRDRALSFDWKSLGGKIGVWRVVLDDLINHDWPDSVVLVPAPLGRTYRDELEGIEILRSLGVAE